MQRRQLFSLCLALPMATLVLPGSAQAWEIGGGWGAKTQGSGKVIDDPRALPAFSKIRMDDSLTVTAKQGSKSAVVVHADDNIAPLILTSVEGDTLVIKLKSGISFRTSSPTSVNLEFTQLQSAELRGSGDLSIDGIKGNKLDLALSGSGDVRLRNADLAALSTSIAGSGDIALQGRSTDFQASIAGSGEIKAADLVAKAVSVSIAGSGDARVHASESLSVRIAGSGDVSYSGNPPKVSSKIAGSGEMRAVR